MTEEPTSGGSDFPQPYIVKRADRGFVASSNVVSSGGNRWSAALTQAAIFATFAFGALPNTASCAAPCRITVVEKETGWPVPLVELRTVNHLRFVSDNAGVIAFDAPEFMGRSTWCDITGHGYEVPVDGFGMRGVRFIPEPGKTVKVEVTRTIIAKRLGRITGSGLFAESQKLGDELDWRDGAVLGCDSVQVAEHRGKRFWMWGDTMLPHYRLGVYDTTGATTALQPLATFAPPVRIPFAHFVDSSGKPRGVAPMPGSGPTWVTGLATVPDKTGRPRLVATYRKIHPPLDAYLAGLCVWNDEAEKFEHLREIWRRSKEAPKALPMPDGHATLWSDPAGKKWLLFGNPLPNLRCEATFEAWQDPQRWEILKPQERLSSAKDGASVKPHSGSIAWNAFRKKWVTVFMQTFGKPSVFGELWYAEADAPTGPWGKTVKILSHQNYTFYNPRLHPELTPSDSPILLFEGTYTEQFAEKPEPTPRYDYNQIIYRIDLDDPALAPAH